MLKINFFTTWLPDDDLPLLVRRGAEGEKLRPSERYLEVGGNPDSAVVIGEGGKAIVAVGPVFDDVLVRGYSPHSYRLRDIAPSVVKQLTSSGLQRALELKGLAIDPDPVGFSCFESSSVPDVQLPNSLEMRRGARFRVDHLSVRGRRIFGFFVSPVSRLRFTVGLADDPTLRNAVIGERVTVVSEGQVPRSAELVAIESRQQRARVVLDDVETILPLTAVQPRATPKAVRRYFEALGRSEDARRVWLAPQVASYRLLPNGQRNRRWLAQQYEHISSWLLGKSESGRLRFQWPQSTIELYVNTEALAVTSSGAA